MALQIIQCCPAHSVCIDPYRKLVARLFGNSQDESANRASVRAILGALQATPDYLPEEKPLFGLGRIGMKFLQNHRGAK